MLPVADWVARLAAEVAGITVHGAAELAAARGEHRRDTLYVFPLEERADANVAESAVVQREHMRIAVLLALTNRRDGRGEAGLDEIERWRAPVKAALIGWRPAGADRPVAFRRGALAGIGDGVVLWQDEFETSYWRES